MTTYRLEMRDLSGSVVEDDVLGDLYAPDLRYSFALNGPGGINVKVPTRLAGVTQANFAVGQRTLHVYRDEVEKWAGYLLTSRGDRDWVTFGGQGWYYAWRARLITTNLYYKDDLATDIAWDLINWTQTVRSGEGDIGVTRGTDTGTAGTRDRHYCKDDFTTVAEAIDELAAAGNGGFDFWLTPGKVWNTAHPRRGSDLTATVTLDADTTVTGFTYEEDATHIVSRLWYNDDPNCGWVDSVHDDTALATYGLWEAGIDLSGIKKAADRDDRAQGRLDRNTEPVSLPNLTVPAELGVEPGDFDLGDSVHVNASDGWLTVNAPYRVIEYDVKVGEGCVEEMTVRLDANHAQGT